MSKKLLEFNIRLLSSKDLDSLREFSYHAIYVAEGDPIPDHEILDQPEIARYITDWGREDDLGFVAEGKRDNQKIGMTWHRLFVGENRGFGYVDDTTPELSIAVLPSFRNQGIGTALLSCLLDSAAMRYPAISLSVADGNPAIRLYQRLGFVKVGRFGNSTTMLKKFHQTTGT